MKNASSSHPDTTDAVTGSPVLRAICPVCGQEVPVTPSPAAASITCSQCGTVLEPVDPQGELGEEEVAHSVHWATGAGLIASLFIHTLLLCLFMVVTWQRDADGRQDEGIEVGLVTDDDRADMASPQVDPIRYEGQWADLAPAVAAGMTELESLGNPDSLISAPDTGSPVGLEMATGGMSGLEGDFAGLGTGAGAGGSARFFGLVARGRKFVYIVDRSGSMSGQRLEDAKKELIRSIRHLPRFAEYYVFFYNNSYVGMPAPGLVRATPENKTQYLDWIDGMQAGGGTDPAGALLEALTLEPDAIWLLSDGEFGAHAANRLKEKNGDLRVQVHAISFHSESGKEILQRIARENAGRYRFVGSGNGRDNVRTRIHR